MKFYTKNTKVLLRNVYLLYSNLAVNHNDLGKRSHKWSTVRDNLKDKDSEI